RGCHPRDIARCPGRARRGAGAGARGRRRQVVAGRHVMSSNVQDGLNKVIGWFVVREDDGPAAPRDAHEDELPDAPQNAPRTPGRRAVVAPAAEPGPAIGEASNASFAEVYRGASIAAEDAERMERALALVASLPPGAPLEVRRAIVAASLQAFGVPVDRI